MKLPNSHLLRVEHEKIVGYLLNLRHLHGASKARFFLEFGFRMEDPQGLAAALREHGQRHEVVLTKDTPFGPRYEVDGRIEAPNGKTLRIKTVWQADEGELAPRLITAYPLKS